MGKRGSVKRALRSSRWPLADLDILRHGGLRHREFQHTIHQSDCEFRRVSVKRQVNGPEDLVHTMLRTYGPFSRPFLSADTLAADSKTVGLYADRVL